MVTTAAGKYLVTTCTKLIYRNEYGSDDSSKSVNSLQRTIRKIAKIQSCYLNTYVYILCMLSHHNQSLSIGFW